MVGIAFFDIDGTLTYGISSGAFIATGWVPATGCEMQRIDTHAVRSEMTRYAILMLVDTLAIG